LDRTCHSNRRSWSPAGCAMRSVWLRIIRTSGARFYWMAAAFGTTILTARLLGADGRGVVAAAASWVALFAVVSGLSVGQVIVFLAAGRLEQEWLSRTLAAVLLLIGVATALAWSGIAIGQIWRHGELFENLDWIIAAVAFAMLPLVMWNDCATALLAAIESLNILNRWQVIGATASIAAVALFVAGFRWGVFGAVMGTGIYHLVFTAGTLTHLVRRTGGVQHDGYVVKRLLSGGVRLHVNAIANFVVMQANVLIISTTRPIRETGQFHFALQLVTGMQILPTVINLVATGFVTREGPDQAWQHQRRLLTQSMGATTAVVLLGYVAAAPVVRWTGGTEFLPAVPMLRVLMLSLFGMTFSMVMASQWIARGLFSTITAVSIFMATASLTANYFYVPRYGAIASAWITVAVYSAGILVNGGLAVWLDVRTRAARANSAASAEGKRGAQ
jgi:O-antigen/teichoic acid export membrane protein